MQLLGLIEWLVVAAGAVIVIVLAPIAAVYWLINGDFVQALLAVAVFVAGIAFSALGLLDTLKRRRSRR